MIIEATKAERAFILLVALYEFIVPFLMVDVLLPKDQFTSPAPYNSCYNHMTVAVYVSLAIINVALLIPSSPLFGCPSVSFQDFQIALLAAFGGASLYIGANDAAGLWLFLCVILFIHRIIYFHRDLSETSEVYFYCCCSRLRNRRGERGKMMMTMTTDTTTNESSSSSSSRRLFRLHPLPTPAIALRVIQIIFFIGLWAGPTLQSWALPVAPYVRWWPYNTLAELQWRAFFATFATFLLIASFDPWRLNRAITGFFAVMGIIHATTMLADNLLGTNENSNPEHLYGDVLGWYIIGLVHLFLGPWFQWWRGKEEDDDDGAFKHRQAVAEEAVGSGGGGGSVMGP